ncbi:MAG: hypothetical protein WC385_02440 [Candidatus Paceibacterota bacterium]
MKNTGKVGNKEGQPKFRTPSTFIANQSLKNSFKGKNFNANRGRSMKMFNRGKV